MSYTPSKPEVVLPTDTQTTHHSATERRNAERTRLEKRLAQMKQESPLPGLGRQREINTLKKQLENLDKPNGMMFR